MKTFRKRIYFFSLLIGLTILLGLLALTKKQAISIRPNIIFIMADDMGFSDIGCYGSEISTPNLDKLATNGIKIRNFYNAGRCCPTRASLLTGKYSHAVGMGNMVTFEDQKVPKGSYQG
jgi:arylsulfatase